MTSRQASRFLLTTFQRHATSCSVMKTYSTQQAARKAGIHVVTLRRWLAAGEFRPSVAVPMAGRTLWRWTSADVEKLKRYREQFGGRWPKEGSRARLRRARQKRLRKDGVQ